MNKEKEKLIEEKAVRHSFQMALMSVKNLVYNTLARQNIVFISQISISIVSIYCYQYDYCCYYYYYYYYYYYCYYHPYYYHYYFYYHYYYSHDYYSIIIFFCVFNLYVPPPYICSTPCCCCCLFVFCFFSRDISLNTHKLICLSMILVNLWKS